MGRRSIRVGSDDLELTCKSGQIFRVNLRNYARTV